MRTFLLSAAFVIAAAHAAAAQTPVLEGAWERTYVRVVLPDTTIEEHFSSSGPRLHKILTARHFAFGRQTDDGENVFAGGGTYVTTSSEYAETYAYHENPSFVGKTITFESSVEDGMIWRISGIVGRFRLEETWRRIE